MSAPVATVTPLEALLQRAGASDQDREAWLAQRKLGITGTEIRDLHIGAKKASELIADKLGRRSNSFAGNGYTRWGNEREVTIGEAIQERYGIAPESRLFRAVDNVRFQVSPDGLGEMFDGSLVGSETKTAGMDVSVGSPAFEKKGYLFQIVWAMVVTGARRWLYAWEERLVVDGGFVPGELRFEWIVWDDEIEAIAAELVAEAEEFLRQLDAAAATDYVEPTVDDAIDTHAVNYLRFLAMESEAGAAKKAEYDAILEAVGEREEFRQEGVTARVTLTPMKIGSRQVVDTELAKTSHPLVFARLEAAQAEVDELLALYTREEPTETKPRLTITPMTPKEKQ